MLPTGRYQPGAAGLFFDQRTLKDRPSVLSRN